MAGSKNVLEFTREDDFVEYYLFPIIDTIEKKEQEVILRSILLEANKVIEKYTKDYLWHKDEFKLAPRTSIYNSLIHIDGKEEYLPPHLYGVSHYGDNVEDEWFMVFILQQLTKEIKGLIARAYDVDGEFLLIEAANVLPRWASPETCENRVYIYNGCIHLVPPTSDENPTISVMEALSEIRSHSAETIASTEIQTAIQEKLKGYPEKTKDNLHRAKAYLPVSIAAILKKKPNLIAPAAQAFCNRDTVDMKACRAMKYFPPEDRVMTRVTFTKCLYAMLTHSKYMPDRRTGWNLPSRSATVYKAHLLGVKIACGFEILASQAKPSSDIESDKGWHAYLNSLKDKGYFKHLLEHSVEYNNLLNKAKEYYSNHRDTMHYSPAIGRDILELLRSRDLNMEELKNEENSLPEDDDDSWLDISPEELDKMLQERYGQKKTFNLNNNADATSFTEKVSKFLNHVSEIEGAEFPDNSVESSPIRPPRRNGKVSFTESARADAKSSNKINFDANNFSCTVQNILNFVIPEDDSWDLDSDDTMSDYENDEYIKNQSYEEGKSKMEAYMEQMDRELASTTIGRFLTQSSFNHEQRKG
ncbi:unnamed protein product [Acanthoscelides obtectus]|uniref:Uncharacterized protein n=1 Tax=Acanthoscelides obtectus TaxID=200917 RepID=A0A9P0LB54_ACAOB|nr:unnamed protein product [Acanthoscelides obtectus]CAK1669852.1 Protein ecdysoneless [Acanthoscelides obtectus]